jgi:WD40 repeat protein
MIYKAFISYSHRSDAAFAKALGVAMQKFAKPWNQLRAFRIFRDTTDLTVTPGLWPSIQMALDNSEYLIYIATPNSADSKWVKKELSYWLENKGPSKLFIVLRAGEIVWDDANTDFDWQRSTALPQVFSQVFKNEPRFEDFRQFTDEQISLQKESFLDPLASLVAPLHGKEKDAIYNENERQHRHTLRLARLVKIGLITLSCIAAFVGALLFWQYAQAQERLRKLARNDFVTAQGKLDVLSDRDAFALLARSLDNEFKVHSGSSIPAEAAIAALNTTTLSTPISLLGKPNGASRPHLEGPDASARESFDEHVDAACFVQDGAASIVRTALRIGRDDWMVSDWNPITGQLLTERSLTSHSGRVQSFTPDGNGIITWGGDCELLNLKGETIASIAFSGSSGGLCEYFTSRTNRLIIHSKMSDELVIVDTKTGDELFRRTEKKLEKICFSSDGTLIAMVHEDGGVGVYNTNSGQTTPLVLDWASESKKPSNFLVFSGDGKQLMTGGDDDDKTARIWDAETGKLLRTLNGLEGRVQGGEFNRDGRHVVVVSNWKAYVWGDQSAPDPKLPTFIKNVRRVVFSPDGEALLVTSYDGGAELWDWRELQLLRRIEVSSASSTEIAEFDPGGSMILTAGSDHVVRVWPTRRAGIVSSIKLQDTQVKHLTFTLNDRRLISTSSDKKIRLWDVASGNRLKEYANNALFSDAPGFALSPKGNRFLVFTLTGAMICDSETGDVLTSFEEKKDDEAIDCLLIAGCFGTDEDEVWTIQSDGRRRRLCRWNVATGTKLSTEPFYDEPVSIQTAGTKDQFVLVLSNPLNSWLWDPKTLKELESPYEDRYRPISDRNASNNRKYVVLGSANHLQVLEGASRKPIQKFTTLEDRFFGAAITRDGARLITEDGATGARIWDVKSRQPIANINTDYSGSIYEAWLSGDELRAALPQSGVNSATIVDLSTGHAVATLRALTTSNSNRLLSYSDSGFRVATGSQNEIQIWTVLPANAGEPPKWFPDWLRWLAGRKTNEDGSLEDLSPEEWWKLKKRLSAEAIRDVPYPQSLYKTWLVWSLSNPAASKLDEYVGDRLRR